MSLELIEDLGYQYATLNSKNKRKYGIFKCYCGTEFRTQIDKVKSGHTKSCGCYYRKVVGKCNATHKLTNHRVYKIWNSMMQRCSNPNDRAYKNYGDRGISVCERWKDISNFIEDMYPTYQEGLTIDREDTNGNYEPSNCRWTTREVQNRNTRVLQINNTSGYRGVSWNKRREKFIVKIGVNSKYKTLGAFNDAISGAIAYNNYVIENNLEHTLNIIEGV